MTALAKMALAALVYSLFTVNGFAQTTPATPAAPTTPAAPANGVAAKVNDQIVSEAAVRRALKSIPVAEQDKARNDVVQHLVENTLIDQYLSALKIAVDPKEVDTQIDAFKADLKKSEQDYATVLKKMEISEADLKEQIANLLRWDHFVNQQATDKALRDMFARIPEGFNNSTVRARHILLPIGQKDGPAQLQAIKNAIEKQVAEELAKLPPDTAPVPKEKKRESLTDEIFANAAKKYSTCPSKNSGGDLMWFPRIGSMVEPFAKVAFELKPFQISDVVTTQFGYHLILVTAHKAGAPVKFEDVKDEVKEVYGIKLREVVVGKMKPKAKIEIMPVK